MTRALRVAVGALLLLLLGGVPSWAATPGPADVVSYLNGDGLHFVTGRSALSSPNGPLAQATAVTDVRPLATWSAQFLAGQGVAQPTVAGTEWVGVLRAGSKVVGVVRASTASGSVALGAYAADTALGTALATAGTGTLVLGDDGAIYRLSGTSVQPVNDRARSVLPRPVDLTVMQQLVLARASVTATGTPTSGSTGTATTTDPATAASPPDRVSLWVLALGAVAAAAALVLGMAWLRRRAVADEAYATVDQFGAHRERRH